jgi:hypothetical protein
MPRSALCGPACVERGGQEWRQQGRVPSLLVGFAAETTSNVVSLIEEPLPLRREGLARG